LLDRVMLKARAAMDPSEQLGLVGSIARRGCGLGEDEKARKLLKETLSIAREHVDKTDISMGFFAASLARFDLPAAMALVRELSNRDKDRVFCLMAS
jgi:hypothetical protein